MNKRIINEYNNYRKHINTNTNNDTLKYVDPIIIKYNDILEIYNIVDINDLEKWIKKNLNEINFFTINRIINSWIRFNLNTFKKHPKYVIFIINYILKFYLKEIGELNKKSKVIESYIVKWLKNKNNKEYDLNLYYDLKEYILKNNILNLY